MTGFLTLFNCKIRPAEHIVCVFPENIISRFDVAVNDVAEEFAKRLQFVFETENLRTCGLYHPKVARYQLRPTQMLYF